MVYTGKDHVAYWMIESDWKLGDPNVDTHQPFNPMETVGVPKPVYTQKQVRTAESQDHVFSWSEMLALGEGELTTIYKDPFLLCTAFSHKAVGGWPANTIDADFTDDDDRDTLAFTYRKYDTAGVSHIDRTIKGIEITKYGWSCEVGDLVREKVSVKCADFGTGYAAFSTDADFDDGHWANWNEHAELGYHSDQVSISWGGSGLSTLGLKWKSFDLSLNLEKTQEHTGESKVASLKWPGNREYTLSVTGRFTNRTLVEEAEADEDDKSHSPVRVTLTDDDANESYIEFTNAIVDNIDKYDIPPAAEAWEGTIMFKGTRKPAANFDGAYSEATDPSARITT